MTYFEAVFYPFAIFSLLGLAATILPFFQASLREKKKWSFACFITAVFLFMLSWRIGMSAGKRHQMILIVPTILLSVYLLSVVREITLRKRKFRLYYWIFPALFVICLCICTGKSLRVREKPYLSEISRILQREDCFDDTIFITVGKIGGILSVPQKLQKFRIEPDDHTVSEKTLSSVERYLSPALLKKRYKKIIFLVVETGKDTVFQQEWNCRYGDVLHLVYEYTNTKNDRYYRLYQLTVPENVRRWKTEAEMLAEFRSKNLIPNPELQKLFQLTPENPEVMALLRRGTHLALPGNGILWPEAWKINVHYGWNPNSQPTVLRVKENSEGSHFLYLSAPNSISLALPGALAAGHRYWLLNGISSFSGECELYGRFYDANNKFVFETRLLKLSWQESTKYNLIDIDLRQQKSGAMRLFVRFFWGGGLVKYCFAICADELSGK